MIEDQNLLVLGEVELVGAYVVMAAVLLSIALWNRIAWWIKAASIVVTFGFFFVTYLSVRHMLGWPTSEQLPDRFELLWAFVQEPDEATRHPGAIYVWAMKLPGEGPIDAAEVYTPGAIDTRVAADQMPRAYRLVYERSAHEEVHEAVVNLIQGTRQIGVTTRKPKKPGEYAPQSRYSFYDRPDPILPPKAAAARPRD